MKSYKGHTNLFTLFALALLVQASFPSLQYDNLVEIDCSESSSQQLCKKLQTQFADNQYLSKLLESVSGETTRFNSGELQSDTEEDAMQELMGQMKERQVQLGTELTVVVGTGQGLKDLCFSQPDTFWYCTRLMENVESILAESSTSGQTEQASSEVAAVKLLNLPKLDLKKPADLTKSVQPLVKAKKLAGKQSMYIMAGLSLFIGLFFTAAGLLQSDGCTAGMFVINKRREDALSKSFESDSVSERIESKILGIGLRRKKNKGNDV